MSRYCVRPNSGRIEPGGEVQVQGMFVESSECYAPGLVRKADVDSDTSGDESRPTAGGKMSG